MNLAISVLGWHITAETVVIGALSGLTYAILGAGLVLLYRATRIINFAHGEIGALAAAVLGKLVLDGHWNFFLAFAVAIALGAAVGAAVEFLILRRLRRAPRVVLLVATIGVAQLLLFAQTQLPRVRQAARYPTPISGSLTIAGIHLRGEHFMVLAVVPAVILGLGWFLTHTRQGVAIRAVADNNAAARLAGISDARVATMVWVLAGALSAVTVVLNNPIRGSIVGFTTVALGPSLLLRALGAGLVGRFESLPLTLVGGIGIGVVEAVAFANIGKPGTVDAIIFVAVVLLVLIRMRDVAIDDSGWTFAYRAQELPDRIRRSSWYRLARHAVVASMVAVAVVLPFVVTRPSQQYLLTRVAIYALIGVSVVVITGWGGQLSLCQFAFVGLGAVLTVAFIQHGVPFAAAVLFAAMGGVIAAMLVGGPALRVRGLFLAVTTLGFAVAAQGWLLPNRIFLGTDPRLYVPRGKWWVVDLHSERTYYFLTLAIVVLCVWSISHLRRTGIGRSIIAVRENDRSAAAMTISPAAAKLTAFSVSGGLAALAGALLMGAAVQMQITAFGPDESLRVVSMAIIGGVGSVAGAVLGAVYVLGLPALIGDTPSVRLLTSGIGLLALLMLRPGGLVQILDELRRLVLRPSPDTADASATDEPAPADPVPAAVTTGNEPAVRPDHGTATGVLDVRDVTVRFGGLVAVSSASLRVDQGEIVGLIGTNGAGKSTLMNAVSGFAPIAEGAIEILGSDVALLSPARRAALGMGRVFQDARLYGDLTALESVMVALEAQERSELVPSLLALGPSRAGERRKQRRALELLELLEIGALRNAYLADLSTGSRRLVEIACLLAVEAPLLLLDEPTAGVSQQETRAFGPRIRHVKDELGASILIVEHDMSLIMDISDRLYCMEAGQVIASGQPDHVRRHPRVIASYLGEDVPSGDAPPELRLDGLSRKDLLTIASDRGIRGLSNRRKHEILRRLEGAGHE
jgi:ABC-type branched-subunit amino acid transport system ATPase component/ABC-type branched-subunit amino acid transport system permease subunit